MEKDEGENFSDRDRIPQKTLGLGDSRQRRAVLISDYHTTHYAGDKPLSNLNLVRFYSTWQWPEDNIKKLSLKPLPTLVSMHKFIINRNQQSNGDHEVHNYTTGCSHMPTPQSQIDLGYHEDCRSAVAHAKQQWPNEKINGCYYCCYPCHTS